MPYNCCVEITLPQPLEGAPPSLYRWPRHNFFEKSKGTMHPVIAYAIAGLAVALCALVGTYFTNKRVESKWYECIKPKITPPAIVFPIVWTILYVLFAIAFGRTLHLYASDFALVFAFILNLICNALWCYLFFAGKSLVPAIITIVTLMLTLVAIFVRASQDRFVRYSMVPYMAWVTFATVLNAMALPNGPKCEAV